MVPFTTSTRDVETVGWQLRRGRPLDHAADRVPVMLEVYAREHSPADGQRVTRLGL